jgi:hypothetical protein
LSNCPVRADLGLQIADAVEDVYRLRADSLAATPGSEQQTAFLHLLQQARKDHFDAQRALTGHIREHGCEE